MRRLNPVYSADTTKDGKALHVHIAQSKNNEKEASSDILSDPIDIGTTRYHYPHEESFFIKNGSE